MREVIGVAFVSAGLFPLTLRSIADRWLDRVHRSRTGRSATARNRRRFDRTLDLAAAALAVLGLLIVGAPDL